MPMSTGRTGLNTIGQLSLPSSMPSPSLSLAEMSPVNTVDPEVAVGRFGVHDGSFGGAPHVNAAYVSAPAAVLRAEYVLPTSSIRQTFLLVPQTSTVSHGAVVSMPTATSSPYSTLPPRITS